MKSQATTTTATHRARRPTHATAGVKADLRRDTANGPSVATTAKPIDAGGARLLVEDDELEGEIGRAHV